MRDGVEQRAGNGKAMMEEDRWVLKKAVRDIAERQVRAGAMRVERERQVDAKLRATKEAVAWMEAERRFTAIKRLLDFSFIFCPINFSLEFSFRLCKIDLPLEISFRLNF